MSDLYGTQKAFANALRGGAAAAVPSSHFLGDEELIERRLALYRGNVLSAVRKALVAAYPVSREVVGDEFFEALTRRYWQESPSKSGDLHDYGATFASFVADFEHTRDLPYLPDLMRVEWSVHRAYGAADAPGLKPQALAAVTAENQGALRLSLVPGTALVRSKYPVVQIWSIHQPGYAGEFAVDWEQAQRALIARVGQRVAVTAVSAASFAFFEALERRLVLQEALAYVQNEAPDADLAQVVTEAIARGPLAALSYGDAT
jgi:hypothetical protein